MDGPRLREALLRLLAAAPPGAERELVTAVSVHVSLACPCSVALCRLLLATLHLPAVCRVRNTRALSPRSHEACLEAEVRRHFELWPYALDPRCAGARMVSALPPLVPR